MMSVLVNWEAVVGIITLLSAIAALNAFVTKMVVRNEFNEFKKDLVTKERYDAEHTAVLDRLNKLEV